MYKDIFVLKNATIPGVMGTRRKIFKGDIIDLRGYEADRLIEAGIARVLEAEDVLKQQEVNKMVGGAPYNKAFSPPLKKTKNRRKRNSSDKKSDIGGFGSSNGQGDISTPSS